MTRFGFDHRVRRRVANGLYRRQSLAGIPLYWRGWQRWLVALTFVRLARESAQLKKENDRIARTIPTKLRTQRRLMAQIQGLHHEIEELRRLRRFNQKANELLLRR
jgi:hypothetical protein